MKPRWEKNVSAVIVSSALVTALITTVSIGRLRPRCGTLWHIYCCYYVADNKMIPAHQWNKNVITLTKLSSLPAKNYNLPWSQWGKCRQNNIFVSEILAGLLQLAFVRYRPRFGILWYVFNCYNRATTGTILAHRWSGNVIISAKLHDCLLKWKLTVQPKWQHLHVIMACLLWYDSDRSRTSWHVSDCHSGTDTHTVMAYYDIYTTATITADTEAVLPHYDMFITCTTGPIPTRFWHIMTCLLL